MIGSSSNVIIIVGNGMRSVGESCQGEATGDHRCDLRSPSRLARIVAAE